jgi:hypothetical protein
MTMRSELHLSKTFSWGTVFVLVSLIITAVLWSGKMDQRMATHEAERGYLADRIAALDSRTNNVTERLAGIEAELRLVAALQQRVLNTLEDRRFGIDARPNGDQR